MCVYAKSLQSCLTLCSSMNYSLPGSSIHGILQARVLEWVTMPSPGNRRFFTISAIWEVFVFCFYFLDSAYKQYYVIFAFLCLTYFAYYDNLQVHPCCCKWHYFILFQWLSNIPLCVCTISSLSVHLSTDIFLASMSLLL